MAIGKLDNLESAIYRLECGGYKGQRAADQRRIMREALEDLYKFRGDHLEVAEHLYQKLQRRKPFSGPDADLSTALLKYMQDLTGSPGPYKP